MAADPQVPINTLKFHTMSLAFYSIITLLYANHYQLPIRNRARDRSSM